jgi:hypothetical protein
MRARPSSTTRPPSPRERAGRSREGAHAALELAERVGVALPLTEIAHDLMAVVWGVE